MSAGEEKGEQYKLECVQYTEYTPHTTLGLSLLHDVAFSSNYDIIVLNAGSITHCSRTKIA